MTEPFDPLTEALRDSLHRHAADAPRGDLLAERIINTAQRAPDAEPRRNRFGLRTWALPLVAAGAVGAVVASVVGIQSLRTDAEQQPGTSGLPSTLQTQLQTQLPSTLPASPSPAPNGGTTTSGPTPTELTGSTITDLTFVGDDDGWALGSAACLAGTGRCTALWRTTDGRHWVGMPGAEFNVAGVDGCADPCVRHIRFANDRVGYAFGPSAFFLTQDGGRSWQREDGGAIQLETLDDNVIRVTVTGDGCPGPCIDGIETAAVGSSEWTPAKFTPSGSFVGGVQLARGNGGDAYLLVTKNPAGGAEDETSTLYRSTDSGRTWEDAGEPCPQVDQEVDSIAVAGGADGRVSVLCAQRGAPHRYFVATSTDAGAKFTAQSLLPLSPYRLLTGDPHTVLIAADLGMMRSTDGGATWQPVGDVLDRVQFVGFESPLVGRAVSADGTTIWTTRDGGATWVPARIG